MTNRLIEPTARWKTPVQTFRQEMIEKQSILAGMGSLRENADFEAWLTRNARFEKQETVPDGFVRSTQYIYANLEEKKVVGMIQLRYELNDYLKNFGGHIGYSITPSERRKGYGKAMLQACFIKAKEAGFRKVLITCNPENEGSRQVILSSGGQYEATVYHEEENRHYEKYWLNC